MHNSAVEVETCAIPAQSASEHNIWRLKFTPIFKPKSAQRQVETHIKIQVCTNPQIDVHGPAVLPIAQKEKKRTISIRGSLPTLHAEGLIDHEDCTHASGRRTTIVERSNA